MPGKISVSYRIILFTVFITGSFFANAQLCTGSLGDPVVNITFGNGTTPDFNFTPPSAYTYTAASCPNDGSYTIATSSSGCFNSTWHSVPSDHTGGGAFMLINASYEPGDFFVATLNGLCANTTYEFASWVMNVLKSTTGIQPDLTFKVETPSGIVLNQFNTGGLPATASPQWQQYGFFFTTTAGFTSVVLRISNNAPGGVGNDLALDDITFRPCGPDITSSIQGSGDNIDLCVYDQFNYTFNGQLSPGFSIPVYQWQTSSDDGSTWTDITGATNLAYVRQPTAAGKFLYRLAVSESGNGTSPGCRVSSNVLTIFVHARPLVDAGPNRILITGNSTVLQGNVTGETPVYSWTPPDDLNDAAILTPSAKPPSDRVYKLSAATAFGCTNEDYVSVKVVAGIFIPTAFTPNNDGKNDRWRIPFLDPLLGAAVSVFNRWGQLVYQSTATIVDWDGKTDGVVQPSGVYVYLVNFKSGQADMKGTVTIIR